MQFLYSSCNFVVVNIYNKLNTCTAVSFFNRHVYSMMVFFCGKLQSSALKINVMSNALQNVWFLLFASKQSISQSDDEFIIAHSKAVGSQLSVPHNK